MYVCTQLSIINDFLILILGNIQGVGLIKILINFIHHKLWE